MKKKFKKGIDNKMLKVYTLDILETITPENKMKNLSIEAKEIINDLFEKGHSPNDIKVAMEDGAFLEDAFISQELAEEIHNFLSNPNIFEAEIALFDENDNEIKRACIWGSDEKKIMVTVEKSIANEKDPSIIYGKIIKFLPIE